MIMGGLLFFLFYFSFSACGFRLSVKVLDVLQAWIVCLTADWEACLARSCLLSL